MLHLRSTDEGMKPMEASSSLPGMERNGRPTQQLTWNDTIQYMMGTKRSDCTNR